jgi:hypothetical protein
MHSFSKWTIDSSIEINHFAWSIFNSEKAVIKTMISSRLISYKWGSNQVLVIAARLVQHDSHQSDIIKGTYTKFSAY